MDFDAIVIGGGHAGIEAALAIARLGFSTLMITQSLDTIGRLSCNPAVGGLAKGNIVRELDALGGEMARLIDASMIQFRLLNRSKGPAVQSPRAQADKRIYSHLAKWTLEQQKNLHLFQDSVVDFVLNSRGDRIRGVVTERGNRIGCKTVVLTTGTFMEGKVFIGQYVTSSGRLGEPAAVGLGSSLRRMGFEVGRLKTGTPARVARDSLDFNQMEEQSGDQRMLSFSFNQTEVDRPSVSCHITFTNQETHRIIRDNLHTSPLFSGMIVGVGPRYCPSLEDKVVRFPDRDRHQIFVEPEGLDTNEMYLNGISTSLPEEVQERFLKTIGGLQHVEILRPGYAVEYDYLSPTQLYPSLETKRFKGLFVAGQTNGTSGYEEAACQGLMAGINAALSMEGKEPLILSRSEAYIGVLIDDLVTLGTKEPYRMFTSRAEYRLSLRHDSADMRLLEKGYDLGLKNSEELKRFREKKEGINEIKELFLQRKLEETQWKNGAFLARDREEKLDLSKYVGKAWSQILKQPEVRIESFQTLEPHLNSVPGEWLRQAELDIKYEGYITRQARQVKRFQKMEKMKIPGDFDYEAVEGLSTEAREKFKQIQPLSVGQASRISGVRAADVAVLIVLLGRHS